MNAAQTVAPVNYRELMKKVEQAVDAIERADDRGDTIRTVASLIIAKFRDELGLFAGRLYKHQGSFYVLEATFGESTDAPVGTRVSLTYGPVETLLDQGIVYMEKSDPGFDQRLEERLGVEQFAAIEVGDGEFLLAFNTLAGQDREGVLFSLGILRHSINQKLRHERMEGIFQEARKIQASILPRRPPQHEPFDIYGSTVPMETVGGDFFDFIPLTDKVLGLALADVSGHGLPAALQTRDIHMGLRMGLSRDFKISRTVERLNEIIHQSTLTSRFVSMFYGELESSGAFIYVNAGHPPPFHLDREGTATPLEEGGTVLGPVSDATYERGFRWIEPGDLLVFYTDGIIEAEQAPEEWQAGRADGGLEEPGPEYGVDRLLEVVRAHRARSSREIVEALFADLEQFTGGEPASDDRTLVVVRCCPQEVETDGGR